MIFLFLADELEETPKPKKKSGKKIKTKTFEFGVGELGGNNLPIVVPVISKHKGKFTTVFYHTMMKFSLSNVVAACL